MNRSNGTPEISCGWSASTWAGLAGLIFFAISSVALGQAGAKDSQKFLGYSEDSRETITEAREQLQKSLSHYNSLLSGEAKKPKSDYKAFNKALVRTEKFADKTRDLVKKMQSQSKKVFKRWQKELDDYQSENLRAFGVVRLEEARRRHDQMIERMRAAGEAYDPLIASLRDQGSYMSRDLSEEALAKLVPMKAEVNLMAERLLARVAVVLEEEVSDEALVAEESLAPADK